ncbi:hypothetical protein EB001_18740 [bacterium]|nr:hypothetical protein [bacterium]
MSQQPYMLPSNPGFMDFINRTFYTADEVDQKQNSGLFPFQRFVRQYINEATPYRGVLLFYGLGAGKSRTSIAACESFLAAGKDVVVITPASLRENFKVEYLAYPPPSLKANPKAGLRDRFTFLNYNGGTSFARSKASEPLGRFDKLDLDNKLLIVDEVHNLVSIIVNAMRSKRFRGVSIYNKIMNAKNLRIIALSGTPIINFPFEVAVLMNILAGYMNNDTTPWDGAGPRLPLFPESEDEFNSTYLDMSNSKSFQISPVAVRSFRDRLVGYVSYYAGLTGKDVYPELTVMPRVKVEMSNYQFFTYVEQRHVEISEMNRTFKTEQYSTMSGKELDMNLVEKKSSFRSSTREVCNFAFPKLIRRPWRRDISAQLRMAAPGKKKMEEDSSLTNLDLELIAEQPDEEVVSREELRKLIDETYHTALEETLETLFASRRGFLLPCAEKPVDYQVDYQLVMKKSVSAAAEPAVAQVVSDCLNIYSPKMLAILENIVSIRGVQGKDGSIVVYSYFNKVEGINIFQNILQKAGYEPYVLKKDDDGHEDDGHEDDEHDDGHDDVEKHGERPKAPGPLGRFCFWSGDNRDQILTIFNSPENMHGQIIKVLLITEAGAEGITLKNVRQLHIMEPYWNEVLIRQVIGRAKRMYSHIALPESERDVTVYRYETTFTTEQKEYITGKLGWNLDEKYTTDEIISMIAERKQFATDQIEEFMKETAVDCYLNKRDNDLHRPEDNPLVCYNIRDSAPPAASVSSAAASGAAAAPRAAPASRFDLSESASKITRTSRFDMSAAKKVVVDYVDVVVEGDKKEYVFVRGKVENNGKELGVFKIYLADPVKRQIGLDEYLVATLYIAGLEKNGQIPLLSTSGKIGKMSSGNVRYVIDLSVTPPIIKRV